MLLQECGVRTTISSSRGNMYIEMTWTVTRTPQFLAFYSSSGLTSGLPSLPVCSPRHCYQSCLLPECRMLPFVEGKEQVPSACAKDSSASFPFGCPPYHSFLPTPCPLCGTCHPVLLLATRERVPAPQIIHSFCSPHRVSLGRTLPAHL